MKKWALFFAVMLLLIPAAGAKQGHITLLAVSETDSGYKGVTADLYLEIEPGNDRVFIESFPLTKLDTQISTRFAKDIACQYIEMDCSNYDFFYTIKGSSAIIGGPSAGAAMSALTVALLGNKRINDSVAITGTINSGGIIGPVGGIKEKIEAAKDLGLGTVIIPKGQGTFNVSSLTRNFSEYGGGMGINVVESYDLDDALVYLTGEEKKKETAPLEIDPGYLGIMGSLAGDICNRSREIILQVQDVDEKFMQEEDAANELHELGLEAKKSGDYYSAASFCFGANVRYRGIEFMSKKYSAGEIRREAEQLMEQSKRFLASLPEIKTVTDVQTFSIVKERIINMEDNINASLAYLEAGETEKSISLLAYATERLYSAHTWGYFFGQGKKIATADLNASCITKLSEAEEMIQYVKLFTPDSISQTELGLKRAYEDFERGEFELCLFKASKAKAEANAAIDFLSVNKEDIKQLVMKKNEMAKKVIIRQTKKGTFPVIGYSYYEYARSLDETEEQSALLYSEYALELSNLDMYFREKKRIRINREEAATFASGFILGVIALYLISTMKKRRRITL